MLRGVVDAWGIVLFSHKLALYDCPERAFVVFLKVLVLESPVPRLLHIFFRHVVRFRAGNYGCVKPDRLLPCMLWSEALRATSLGYPLFGGRIGSAAEGVDESPAGGDARGNTHGVSIIVGCARESFSFNANDCGTLCALLSAVRTNRI